MGRSKKHSSPTDMERCQKKLFFLSYSNSVPSSQKCTSSVIIINATNSRTNKREDGHNDDGEDERVFLDIPIGGKKSNPSSSLSSSSTSKKHQQQKRRERRSRRRQTRQRKRKARERERTLLSPWTLCKRRQKSLLKHVKSSHTHTHTRRR